MLDEPNANSTNSQPHRPGRKNKGAKGRVIRFPDLSRVVMMPSAIIRLWRAQTDATWFCISTKSQSGKWDDDFFTRDEFHKVPAFIAENLDCNIFFCPHGFTEESRTKRCAVLPNMFWADLDEIDPRACPIRPTIAIESSPGRYVGLWAADHPITEELNRKLTYSLGADKGGWDLTQVLRMPGTVNHKYKEKPKVKALWIDGPRYTVAQIEAAIDPGPQDGGDDDEASDDGDDAPIDEAKAPEVIARYRSRGGKVVSTLDALKRPPGRGDDRSELLWKFGHELVERGMSREDAAIILKASEWNKFEGRDDEDERIWDCVPEQLGGSGNRMGKVVNMKAERSEDVSDEALGEMTSGEFARSFTAPEYLIDGAVQRGYLYALTARPGDGKTSTMLLIAMLCAMRRSLAHIELAQGAVLFLAGENCEDVKRRWIALCEDQKVEPERVKVRFLTKIFNIAAATDRIGEIAEEMGGFCLIVVDSSVAYFPGKDEDDNTEQKRYWQDMRGLTMVKGKPTVICLCNPGHNATRDNLRPRGGSSIMGEIDGNLTCVKDDTLVTFHWQKKLRDSDFAPMTFELKSVFSDQLVDAKGRKIPTVIARTLTSEESQRLEDKAHTDRDKLLRLMLVKPSASLSDLATGAGWYYEKRKDDGKREANKTKAYRLMIELQEEGLVTKARDRWNLTKKGKEEAEQAKQEALAE